MNSLYHKAKMKLVNWIYKHVVPTIDDIKADKAIRRLQKRACDINSPIKVGFIVQMPEIWNKESLIYEDMAADSRFDPWLIVVPEKKLTESTQHNYGRELAYFIDKYPNGKFLTSTELSEDFSGLEKNRFDYIFYQRCWEGYLPSSLMTCNVIQYAKTCYVPYYYSLHLHSEDYFNSRFFNSLYVQFCSCKEEYDYYRVTGLRKSVYLGSPYLSKIHPSECTKASYKVLWTPRWEMNTFGGTSFFEYKDRFVDLKQAHPDWEVVLRPHPLTFQEAVRTNRMTYEEVKRYQQNTIKAGVKFDENANIDDSLMDTTVLISDASSVIIDAFMAEIPMIYCEKEEKEQRTSTFSKILDCSYIAHSWEEVENYLNMLSRGEDRFHKKRKEYAQELCKTNPGAEPILSFLVQDYYKGAADRSQNRHH